MERNENVVGYVWIQDTLYHYRMLMFPIVDAICIDQSNVGEREAQVAKMEQIYDESSKVLVYLGPDIVSKTQRFPTYKTLYDLTDASSILSPFPRLHPLHDNPPDLHQLLRRKYFSRIWVVQELILSEKIVFTVGDTEYRADPRVMSKLNNFAWEKTAAPWVRHIASKGFPKDRVKGFDSLIKLTANCKASDPRDLLFGTRGLLDNDTEKDSFPTNYSLSFQQFYIGIHAHWLLNVKDWSVLLTAGILAKASNSSTPSWVPDISTPDLWPMDFAGHLREHNLLLSLEDIERSRDNAKKTFYRINMPRSRGDELLLTPLNGLIQHDTGALSLTAIFVLRFERVPRLVGHFGKTNIYCLDSQDADASVDMTGLRLLLVSTLPLHDIVTLPLDYLYMSDSSATWNDKYGYHFMILRANITDDRPNDYQLVSSDVFMMEGSLYNLEQAASSPPEHDTKAIHLTASWIRKSVAELISDICTVRQRIRLHTSSEVLSIYKQHAPACWLRPPWHQIFPWIADEDVLRNVFATLSKYLCVNREQWNRIDGEDRFFRDAYLACVSSRNEQEVSDDKLIIKFNCEQWTRCGGLYIPLDFDHWSMTLTNFKARQPFYRQFVDRGRGGYRARGYGGRFPNYLNPLEAHQVELNGIRAHYAQLTWQWKWETSNTWQPCARNSQPRLEDFSKDHPRLWVTTPILGVARFLRKELDFTVRMLSSLRNSYSLDVDIDSVIEMINLGPQKEQEERIAAKDIGGIRIEGQQRRITLI
ncbi:hypothetical protein SLS60_003542 [Paraconiothyrium brasiliense]|uniref:Heterokaryon incompatibility domain-containing protein n=1 Tax=Paraconiothyrium brasiliense TaxID=300254 RepID=A0ABR3RNX8_9PLEO